MNISINQIDAFEFKGDVLVLKHAQALYGLDRAVVDKLATIQPNVEKSLPLPNNELIINSLGVVNYDKILFIGVISLYEFKYEEIREFVKRALKKLIDISPYPEKVVFTLHGVGYGLDVEKTFLAELNGIKDAYEERLFSNQLEEIIFVERDYEVFTKASSVLKDFLNKNNKAFHSRLNCLNEKTFKLLSKSFNNSKSKSPSDKTFGIQELLKQLNQENEDFEVVQYVEEIKERLVKFEIELQNESLERIDRFDFIFNKLNPVYLDIQIISQKLIDKNYLEVTWICQVYGIKYLISVCEKLGLKDSYFVNKIEELKSQAKMNLLNYFGERLIPIGKFPWLLVNEMLKANNIEKYWDIFLKLNKAPNNVQNGNAP